MDTQKHVACHLRCRRRTVRVVSAVLLVATPALHAQTPANRQDKETLRMSTTQAITVGPASADIVGADNAAIQKAVDKAAAQGGGVVEILSGTYEMHDSLHLRTGVCVRGAGAKTVLRKAAMVESKLSADLGYGHYDVSLAEPDKFRVGMGVYIRDDNAGGFYTTVASLTWRRGDRFGISRFLNHDYSRGRNGIVQSLFPVVSGYHLKDASIENVSIDGNREQNELLNGCRGSGVFLLQATNVTIRGVEVRNYNGDGISFQQTLDVLIEDCVCEDNAGHGLHPGSGSVRPIMRNCRCIGNGNDGIFYCLRVTYSLTEGCTLEKNGGMGISVGGRDTDHLIRNNTIRLNGRHGLYFRKGDGAMAGHRCRFEANTLEHNCQKEGRGEIHIDGATQDTHILRNTIRVSEDVADPVGIVVGPEASRIVAHGNRVEPPAATGVDVQGDAGSVSAAAPTEPLAVGPDAAPAHACWHLRTMPLSGE